MIRGFTAIAGAMVLTVAAWAASTTATATSPVGRIGELFGALALVTLAAMLVIATRWPVVDRLFAGQDKAYVAHKWLGLTSLTLLGAHLITLHAAGLPRSSLRLVHAGVPALLLFLVVVVLALAARRMSYQKWTRVHLLVVVPYGIGLAHYIGASSFHALGDSPFSLWMDAINLTGAVAAIWAVVFFGRLGPRRRYVVTDRRPVATDVAQIRVEPVGRPITFRPGQFAFVTVPRLKFASHPFTISSGPGEPLHFTIRALGDDTTRLVRHLRTGDRMTVAGPYGGFNPLDGAATQLWIAAGIGITPFRSLWRAGLPDRMTVDLFYAFHGDGGAYLDELRAISHPNLRVHLVDTAAEGRLTAAMIASQAPSTGPRDVYFCGPKPLRDTLRRSLPSAGVTLAGFHFEEFGFGRPSTTRRRSASGPVTQPADRHTRRR